MPKESDISKSVEHRLDYWQSVGVVMWHDRYNSGKMNVGTRWIQMCKAGTPDRIAFIKHNNLCYILFLEIKSSDKSNWNPSQQDFCNKFKWMHNVVYRLITHPKQIDQIIEEITNYTERTLNNISI